MRYISRVPGLSKPLGYYDFETGGPGQITVHEAEDEPQWTGLYDAQGNELCRVADKLPMGFRLK